MKLRLFILFCISILSIVTWNTLNTEKENALLSEESDHLKIPLGLPPIPWPKDNPYSKKKAELGRLLYFDKRLSSDGTVSCASCHSIPRAFADPHKISVGIEQRLGTRHAPTIINSAYQKLLFWDGRANSLEEQCKKPISNPKEMTLADNVHLAYRECQQRIHDISGYRLLFKEVFGNDACTIDDISKAIATFERTILSGNSPYDRYKAGDKSALSHSEHNGYKVFLRSGCLDCHNGPLFTDERFTNIGIGFAKPQPDLGRYTITHEKKDWGAFKVPTLREVVHTSPYMHDGSIVTLEGVVDYYDKGGTANPHLHRLMKPLHLSQKEKADLVSFLKALSGEGWQHFSEPDAFP